MTTRDVIKGPLNSVCTLVCAVLGVAADASAQFSVSPPSRASRTNDGNIPSGTSGAPVAAPNGSVFLFRSTAGNLVPNDTNNSSDIFQYTVENGTVSRVSVSTSGGQGDGDSTAPAISPIQPDNFFGISFLSTATTLGSFANPDGINHVHLRLPTIGFTGLVSSRIDGTPADSDSYPPSLTSLAAPNQILVTFASDATNLVDGDTNNDRDIFFAKFTASKTGASLSQMTKITNVPGSQPDGDSDSPQISADGRYIVFASNATNLISGLSVATGKQIYLFDTQTNAISLISKSASGAPGSGNSESPKISYKGDFIAYLTSASNIVSTASNNTTAVVLYNTVTGTTTQINTSSTGAASNGDAQDLNLSASGRYVTFSDTGDNLVPSDTNGATDVFTKDVPTGAIATASLSSSGTSTDGASDTAILGLFGFNSVIGRVGFRSFANNLISDGSGNLGNVFASDIALPVPSLSPATQIEVPADVTLNKRRATIFVQQFGSIVETGAALTKQAPVLAAATAPRTIKYDIRLNQVGGGRQRFQRITKRNTESFTRVPAGTYNVRYRVVVESKKKTVFRTEFSPTRRIEVTK